MASSKRKKKGFAIKFDLSLGGLFGAGVVCFCIFLWMFLLGIWSGQTVLSPGQQQMTGLKKSQLSTLVTIAKKPAPSASRAVDVPVVTAVLAPALKRKKVTGVAKKAVVNKNKQVADPEEDPAFFAVQVAAFKDPALAVKEMRSWQDKGYRPFSRPPEGADDKFTRVYVGRFDSVDVAKKKAADLARKEKIKPFIALVPAE